MRLLARVLGGTFVAVLVSIILAAFFVLEDAPALQIAPPPTPQDVVATRQLVRDLRSGVAVDQDRRPAVVTTLPQLNSAIRLGARFIPGFRGDVAAQGNTLLGRASIPIPILGGNKWLNLTATVPAFEGHVSFDQITLGSTSLPPDIAVAFARRGANLYFGQNMGDTLLGAASAMAIDGDTVTFNLTLEAIGDNGLMTTVFGAVRGQDFPSPEDIEDAYLRIHTAMDAGTLATTGSFVPYLRFALQDARNTATPGNLQNAYTASIFALTQICGPDNFGEIVGRLAIATNSVTTTWNTNCANLTLNGRADSRRHFIASAAIRAAANRGISYSIGEFKELHDSVSGAGGFDFTDIAANASGIRMTDYFMTLEQNQWSAAIDRLTTERSVIVTFDDIPPLMSEDDFNARFGTIESEPYQNMLRSIERRIDNLGLYSAD